MSIFLILVLVLQAKIALNFNLLSLSKHKQKTNYSIDSYFKDTLCAGPSKMDKVPKMPQALKQIALYAIFPNFCNELYSSVDHII
jgi:SWI/SNF-related matrix-associated actin-dependent regulator of chromatin subfamily A member 5